MPRNWQTIVDGMSDVQKLVHLAMRLDDFEVDRVRGELVRDGRRFYEDELTIQAQRVGCRSRRGQLTKGPSLSELNRRYGEHAGGIVNTYNFDLAGAIIAIGSEVPTANRHVYANRLKGWEAKRDAWKQPQVARMTEGFARQQAQRDFYRLNNIDGVAVLVPRTAVCPVCQGWIDRGKVPLREATNNAPPYHVGCPHRFKTIPAQKVADCETLWMGE